MVRNVKTSGQYQHALFYVGFKILEVQNIPGSYFC
jgi:hypothetical protein